MASLTVSRSHKCAYEYISTIQQYLMKIDGIDHSRVTLALSERCFLLILRHIFILRYRVLNY